jgi:membrane-associated phospholipid phosphatase
VPATGASVDVQGAGMDIARGTRLARSRPAWVLGQAALVSLGVFVYFRVRGLTEGSEDVAVTHARDIAALERRLGIAIEADVQAPVAASDLGEAFVNWVYIWGHWPVIIVTMGVLAVYRRDVFRRLRDGMLVSGAIGLFIFAYYPVAPPRLVHDGLVDTVTQSSRSYRVLQPPAFVNQYAAMPSLHSGWDLLIGIAIFTAATTTWLKVVGVLLPLAMMFAVVATANHYVVDVVAGIALALFGHAVALTLERVRIARARGAP